MRMDTWTLTSHQATAGLTKHTDQLLLMDCELNMLKFQPHKIVVNILNLKQYCFTIRVIGPKDDDRRFRP